MTVTAEGIALILSATATLVTAVGTTVVLIMRREVKEVKHQTNAAASDARIYQQDLIAALQQAGIHVPRDKSTTGGKP